MPYSKDGIQTGMDFDVLLHLKVDADFSPQYQHNLTRHDLRGDIPGGRVAVGSAGTATVALYHLRQSSASAARTV